MACRLSFNQLAVLLSTSPFQDAIGGKDLWVTGITTDSRSIQPGELFVALRGDRFDGHDFLGVAQAAGAAAAIVELDFKDSVNSLPLFHVKDTLQAYQGIARWWRQQFAIPVIAITGSVGKTTTKELIAAVLGTSGKVLKSPANHNNEIGVPKTLLTLEAEHEFAVIEMGMRGLGEIALLSQIAMPTVAVITNVGTAHIGRLGSETAIAQAKCELLAEMPTDGIAILNHDNGLLMERSRQVWPGRQITYGLDGGDLQGQLIDAYTLEVRGRRLPLPLPGRHNALNYLAAIAVAEALNLDWSGLTAGLAVQLPDGRAQRFELSQDVVVLDETYNAGFESMTAALQLLAQTPGKRRIAVLGTMKELGDWSVSLHQRVGAIAKELGLDALWILADPDEAQALAAGASPLATQQFASHQDLIHHLQTEIQPGDRLLFKASRAVGLDRVVNELRAAFSSAPNQLSVH